MIGKRVKGHEIISLIGEGGMGNVYKAKHSEIGRIVAVKMLHPRYLSETSLKERFKNEARALAQLQHPNIVTLYDYEESEEGLFLIMEYVEGQELDQYIHKVTGPIPEESALGIMEQVLDAFGYAHSKGIVHRDIKPSNILITKDGKVKVLDFGIAKMVDADRSMTKTGTQMGTVLYMSPEQVEGKSVTHYSDIFSLGVTLHQMVTGHVPYEGINTEFQVYNKIVNEDLPPARSLYPGVTQKFEKAIQKATKKNPADRFESCDEFWKFLKSDYIPEEEQVLQDNQEKKQDSSGKKKSQIRYVLIIILVLVIGIAGVIIGINSDNSEGNVDSNEPGAEHSMSDTSSQGQSENNEDQPSIQNEVSVPSARIILPSKKVFASVPFEIDLESDASEDKLRVYCIGCTLNSIGSNRFEGIANSIGSVTLVVDFTDDKGQSHEVARESLTVERTPINHSPEATVKNWIKSLSNNGVRLEQGWELINSVPRFSDFISYRNGYGTTSNTVILSVETEAYLVDGNGDPVNEVTIIAKYEAYDPANNDWLLTQRFTLRKNGNGWSIIELENQNAVQL